MVVIVAQANSSHGGATLVANFLPAGEDRGSEHITLELVNEIQVRN